MTKEGRRSKKSDRKLALDIGNSWREVAWNCHVDPEGNEREEGENND